MYELFEILERNGLVGLPDLDNIRDLPPSKLEKLYSLTYTSIYDAQNARIGSKHSSSPPETFSFHASASIRGASGCDSIECRFNKLGFLARYAALYASELTFPLSMVAPERVDGPSSMRSALINDLSALLLMRPLVTGQIVIPVVMKTQHCIHEIELMRKTTELVHEFSRTAARTLVSQFRLLYQVPGKSPTGRATIYLDGPQEYIEHGGLVRLYNHPPRWIPKTARFDKLGRFEIRGKHKLHLVTDIFSQIADNMTFYLAYGTRRNARFLSDMEGETEFLDWLTDDEQMSARSTALRELEHCVPVLADVPIATILRIRRQERDSFQAYRDSITRVSSSILLSGKRISKREAREMFRAAIAPEIRRIKREVVTGRKSQSKRILGGFGSLAAGVLIGAFAGLPPLLSVPLVGAATVVGGRLLSKAAESACEHGPELRQRNELYFLLRLVDEA
jgi:hypothetical protein